MKKSIIKMAFFIIVFFTSLIVIGRIMNRENNNMTMEMSPATLPVITMEKDGIAYNRLHGYRKAMNVPLQRQPITELGKNRDTFISIDTYGAAIASISLELRSADGERLIENSSITEYRERDGQIRTKVELKDLMDTDTEYALVILLDMENGETIRYYTRVILSERTFAEEKIRFVKEFHEKLYDKEAARDLVIYLESNELGDNSTFHKVNIHSSFHMITWGNLNVKEFMAPVIQLTELASQTASCILDFIVSVSEDNRTEFYLVREFFRIRYTPDRIYLLSYERTMEQIPDLEEDMYVNDKILLGIVGENIPFIESEDGNIIVFEVANRLLSYRLTDNEMVLLFSFYDSENADTRTLNRQHNFKILDVDEGGNVRFAVYGYMNRGRHEGEVGIQIYYYDSGLNTVEEAAYIPYNKSYEILTAEMDQLLYMNRENKLFFFMENTIYSICLNEKVYEEVVTISKDDSLKVSGNHKILVWQEGHDFYNSTSLVVKNLNAGTENTIMAGRGEVILPLGFMEEDIIYGVARQGDIVREHTGRDIFPMYKVCIQNSDGELLKDHRPLGESIYITGCSIVDNQIILDQIQRREDGTFQEADRFQIMYNLEIEQGKNTLVVARTETFGKFVQIQVRRTIDAKALKVLTPKEVMFEGSRELNLWSESENPRYYVYGAYVVDGIYNSPSNAIERAYSIPGVVSNNQGDLVWLRGNRAVRNQIMAITARERVEGESSLAFCLDTILDFEGIVRNSQYLLNRGQTAMEILQESLEDIQVLELTGCSLDAILFYVDRDIPVLAILDSGEAVLITGFNEYNIIIVDPDVESGKPFQKGRNDSTQWFAENGNRFIAYIRN